MGVKGVEITGALGYRTIHQVLTLRMCLHPSLAPFCATMRDCEPLQRLTRTRFPLTRPCLLV